MNENSNSFLREIMSDDQADMLLAQAQDLEDKFINELTPMVPEQEESVRGVFRRGFGSGVVAAHIFRTVR